MDAGERVSAAPPALRFTMSGLARAIECPAHLVLPHSRTMSAFASHGKVVHDFLERVRTMGTEAALRFVPPEHRSACESLDLDNPALALDPSAYAAEVAFAYDLKTKKARELGRGLNRDYSGATKFEVCGTADVVGLTDDAVIIIDYKTGYADLGPLWKNWQLRAYALAAARAYDRQRAIVIIVRIKSDGDAYATPGAELSELDLALTAAEMEVLVDRTVELEEVLQNKGAEALPTSQGPWCTYCPAFDRCPAKTGLVRAALAGEVTTPPLEDFNDAAWAVALAQLERLEGITKRMRSNVEARAMAQPFATLVDEVFGPSETKRRWIDARKGLAALLEFFGADVDRVIKHEVTLKDLAKVAAPIVQGRKDPRTGRKLGAKRYVDDVFERLVELGAAGVTLSYPVRRHKPKADDSFLPDVDEW